MGYNLLINGVFWGYSPLILTFLLTSWNIQVVGQQIQQQKSRVPVNVEIRQKHSMARRQDLLVETGPGELTGLKRWINGELGIIEGISLLLRHHIITDSYIFLFKYHPCYIITNSNPFITDSLLLILKYAPCYITLVVTVTTRMATYIFSWQIPPHECQDFILGVGQFASQWLKYRVFASHKDVSKNRGSFPPKWMVKIMEHPIKMDDLGVPLFLETSTNLHYFIYSPRKLTNENGKPTIWRCISD